MVYFSCHSERDLQKLKEEFWHQQMKIDEMNILKSELNVMDIPVTWKSGINPLVECTTRKEGQTEAEWVAENWGPGKACQHGLTCNFQGKEVRCFVSCSPNASVTSQMLADMLALMDMVEVFE